MLHDLDGSMVHSFLGQRFGWFMSRDSLTISQGKVMGEQFSGRGGCCYTTREGLWGYCDESFKRFQKDWTNELTESHRGKEK